MAESLDIRCAAEGSNIGVSYLMGESDSPTDGAGNALEGNEPYEFGLGEPSNFTWYQSFTEAMLALPTRDEQIRFVFGLIGYGAFGIDPLFTEPTLKPMFRLVQPIIDTNIKKINGGKKGGRPPKEQCLKP